MAITAIKVHHTQGSMQQQQDIMPPSEWCLLASALVFRLNALEEPMDLCRPSQRVLHARRDITVLI